MMSLLYMLKASVLVNGLRERDSTEQKESKRTDHSVAFQVPKKTLEGKGACAQRFKK